VTKESPIVVSFPGGKKRKKAPFAVKEGEEGPTRAASARAGKKGKSVPAAEEEKEEGVKGSQTLFPISSGERKKKGKEGLPGSCPLGRLIAKNTLFNKRFWEATSLKSFGIFFLDLGNLCFFVFLTQNFKYSVFLFSFRGVATLTLLKREKKRGRALVYRERKREGRGRTPEMGTASAPP